MDCEGGKDSPFPAPGLALKVAAISPCAALVDQPAGLQCPSRGSPGSRLLLSFRLNRYQTNDYWGKIDFILMDPRTNHHPRLSSVITFVQESISTGIIYTVGTYMSGGGIVLDVVMLKESMYTLPHT